MVFTEQQLQVKKLVDVQQDIEIDALNDGVNRVVSNVVKNTQDISAQSDRISEAEVKIGNLETADTQLHNTIEQVQTANGQAITDAVSAVMTSIGTQVTTEKVVAGNINIPNINSEIPVESNKVLGYDAEGNIIPVEATYELGMPASAAFLKTDSQSNVEVGVPDTTVTENSTNLVTSGAVYNAIDSATTNLDTKIDTEVNTLDTKIDTTAGALGNRIDAIANGQSLIIHNNPYENKSVNKPGMRTIVYDPTDNESYWSDINMVPPMDSNTTGKYLTNNNNIPQWADVPNELPNYTTADNGKSLRVVNNSGTAELEWVKDVPDYASSDVGKVLTVKDNNGSTELGWESEKELPLYTTSQANKVLTVKNNNGTAEVTWENTQNALPSTTGNAGKVLTVNSTGDGVEWKSNDTLSASDHSASKSYLVKGAGSDGDVAHYLRGDGTWGEIPNTLPDFGSTDAGKVLVINANGTNPEWGNNSPALLRAGNNTSISNEATDNGNTYLKIVDGDSISSLRISGSKGTNVTSDAEGNITISSSEVPSYNGLDHKTNNNSYAKYLVYGPGKTHANTKYYLAGNGTWVNGILVPVPTEEGKTLKSHADGTVYWG